MRLSERKIDYLGKMIYSALKNSDFCVMERAEGPVVEAIKNTIIEDLRTEDEIEEEARRILDEHDDEIRKKGADYHTMFKKTKALLAREKKFTL